MSSFAALWLQIIAIIAAVVAAAVLLARLAQLARLPPLLGMIAGGFLVALVPSPWPDAAGPTAAVASSIRLGVLAVLLLKAGLGLSLDDLRHAGSLALRLGLVPMLAEAATVAALGVALLHLPPAAALLLGFVFAPVSPAIVIPGVLRLLEPARGAARRVPAALLAGAPIDNIAAVIALGVTLDVATGSSAGGLSAVVTLSRQVALGVAAGLAAGLLLARPLRQLAHRPGAGQSPDGRWLAAVPLIVAGGLIVAGRWLGFSSVLAILTVGTTLRARSPEVADRLAGSLQRVWSVAQFALFGLIGAAVDAGPLSAIGGAAVATVLVAQLGRAAGTMAATIGSRLWLRERLACVLAYVPKATIQAAFASLPLDRGLESGSTLLTVGVLAIVITAPVGTLCLDRGASALLSARAGARSSAADPDQP